MAKQTVVRARVEPELKTSVERVLDQLGLSTSQAITLFLKQIELRQGLPFPVELPNRETLKTFRDTDKGKNLKRFNNADELFDDLDIWYCVQSVPTASRRTWSWHASVETISISFER